MISMHLFIIDKGFVDWLLFSSYIPYHLVFFKLLKKKLNWFSFFSQCQIHDWVVQTFDKLHCYWGENEIKEKKKTYSRVWKKKMFSFALINFGFLPAVFPTDDYFLFEIFCNNQSVTVAKWKLSAKNPFQPFVSCWVS